MQCRSFRSQVAQIWQQCFRCLEQPPACWSARWGETATEDWPSYCDGQAVVITLYLSPMPRNHPRNTNTRHHFTPGCCEMR